MGDSKRLKEIKSSTHKDSYSGLDGIQEHRNRTPASHNTKPMEKSKVKE